MVYPLLSAARNSGKKLLAVLIDPDKARRDNLGELASFANAGLIDLFLWGGSLVNAPQSEYYLKLLRSSLDAAPVVLFPGSSYQLDAQADALLLLSLLSGRNPDLLIGQHVQVAAHIKRMKLEAIPTAYLLIDGGKPTSVSYMSNTTPIPADKPQITTATALAGEQLGMKLIYLDAGSGAQNPISATMIACVRHEVSLPIIVGGGIRTPERAAQALEAGADVIVVGNGLEQDSSWLPSLAAAVRAASRPPTETLDPTKASTQKTLR
ncbi:geranylgeranylglyceryl/heptaprenylglyceryl phosphate synthase [Neolewinella lacunae]|uniref:Geranylgeranylglyceryl phosphate synthase n=1 Tax=Neolewinella lacunae TaxID=1517758 RepID=A0A923T7R1_9BACT|nr:geranylgeranylglyceryl/heptaprenylglyceryl phosphate synthase [Neolewinella lacunae]MBC6993819.1 geranylgeranylglyceryl/heptaprenylglyceryl phosphate synthase [Neolewinella lacunae]MDN3635290.1 geranylgeranylglyceryl/heptaprenylglyceryl phosphate synthase [Neolewinella lacunae]